MHADAAASAPVATPTGAAVATKNVPRRKFLGYVIKGGALAMAGRFVTDGLNPSPAEAQLAIPELANELDLTDLLIISGTPFYFDFLIEITPDNRVRFELPRQEVGQGILTAAVIILADELDCRVEDVDATLSPAEIRRQTGQITGGSHAVISLWEPMRTVVSRMRAMLVTAAADAFDIAEADVVLEDTQAFAPDGRTLTFGELSEAAAQVTPPPIATPKALDQHKVIGQPRGRLDARDIVTGRFDYAMDLDVAPGAMPTVVARPPTLGGEVESVDDSAALAMPGVEAIAVVPAGVAVVAKTFGQAFAARDALQVRWTAGVGDDISDADIYERLRQINIPTTPLPNLLGETIEATFEFPYMPQMPMETGTAIADVRDDSATVWTGAKTPISAQFNIARAIGLPQDAVTVNCINVGGSFGRRLFYDAAVEAAQISQIVGRPVKLMWTRQEDTKIGRARPLSIHNLRATTLGGNVTTFEHRCATPELDLRHGFGEAITAIGGELSPFGFSQTVWHTTQTVPYEVGLTTLLLNEEPFPFPTSSWRGIYAGTAMVANEIMIDEIARALGQDEYEFRRTKIDTDRGRAVLDKVAEVGDWGRTLPSGVAQGLGFHEEYRSDVAALVEIDTNGAEPRVTKAVIAVDVGRVINPTGLEAQMQGAFTDSISAILRAAIHMENGAIRESSFEDVLFARMRHSPPQMEVHIMPSNRENPGGAGELAIAASSAAIANAWARATGLKPRRFPLLEFPEG